MPLSPIALVTADQIFAHLIGDYILQSHWMATEKGKSSVAAAVHAVAYTVPFLFLADSVPALLFIAGTHFLIDRYRLARFLVWAKNQIGPKRLAWTDCQVTGYPSDVPPWLAVWLLIIADNTMHLACNAFALRFL